MTPIGKALLALGMTALMLLAAGSRAELVASTDRQQVALGDTLRLVITATDKEDVGELDLRPLTQDFEILQRSSRSNTSIINGSYSSTRELLLDITPRREGLLTIPAMRLGQQASNSLQVSVGPPPAAGSTGGQQVLFEAEVDRSSVYVQGQVILTLRLQQAVNLDDRSITDLQLDKAFVRPLEQQSYQRTINGQPWLVHEVRYAIFPEQSGTLSIPAQTFSARESVPRRSLFDLGGNGRQVRRTTEAITVEVLPRPSSYPDTTWLPASELTVEESWSTAPEQLRVGESATRTITIRGAGLQGAQLPPVLFPATQGLKYYPDQPVVNDSEAAAGLVGTRIDSVAVVPTQAGSWQVPELRIPWWDTNTNELRYAVLPGRQLEVAAAEPGVATAGTTPLPLPATQANTPQPGINLTAVPSGDVRMWQIISIVNGIGWLATLAYLLWYRRRGARPKASDKVADQKEKQAFDALLAACANNNAAQARQALIAWTARLVPQAQPVSLAQAGAALADTAMDAALDALNSALYSTAAAAWNGDALAQCARKLRKEWPHRRRDTATQELSLYPRAA